jgi:hypothetical protein
LIPTRIREDPD